MKRALSLLFGLLSGCATSQSAKLQHIQTWEQEFQHLAQYEEVKCSARIQLSEPVKAAWQKQAQLSSSKKINEFENTVYAWRSTPYRCTWLPTPTNTIKSLTPLVQDAEAKLQNVVCVWLQSFYFDSPLRGWNQGEVGLEEQEKGLFLKKGENRGLEFQDAAQTVVAHLGANKATLAARYQMIKNQRWPQSIEQRTQSHTARLEDIEYREDGNRLSLKSFWFLLPMGSGGDPVSYFQVQVTRCEWRRRSL